MKTNMRMMNKLRASCLLYRIYCNGLSRRMSLKSTVINCLWILLNDYQNLSGNDNSLITTRVTS